MKKINISFKETELHLLDYLKTKRSASNYVKDLIEADIKKNSKTTQKECKKLEKEELTW